jgi:uncharacterized protein YecE (DUF72 family)
MSMRVRTGTSGYSFPEWKGHFYPEKLPAGDMLRFYAERFSTVELNNTFYRMPTERVARGWADHVPDGFTFAVKAPRRITRLTDVADPLGFFLRSVSHLGEHLGPILVQLPPTARKDTGKLRGFFDETPPGHRIAFEFRHASWFDDEVFDVLRANQAALCVADLGDKLAVPLVATTDWGYLRLRREDFGDTHLREWAQRILEQPWTDAFVFLKHEEEGRGPKLATRLAEFCAAEVDHEGTGNA